ncbi:MAG: LamG-like jellyroll fold domain-containing protein, partial [Nitrosarchaeum sp.]
MKKIFVIFLIIGLLAVFPNYNIPKNSYADNLIQENTNSLLYENTNLLSYESNKSILLNLHETLNLQLDSSNYNPKSLPTNVDYKISLVDNLHIDIDDKKFDNIVLVSNPYDKIKLMERIKPNEQKNIFLSNDHSISDPLAVTDSQYFDDTLVDINEFNLLPFTFNYFTDNTNTKNTIIHEVFKLEQLTQNFDGHLVLIFIPFIGFLFFKLEYGKISIARSRSSLSSFVIVLLVFSAFSSPFTISFNYYGSAYAEEFSFSGIIKDDLNNHLDSNNGVKVTIEPLSTPIVLDNSTDSNDKSIIDTPAEPIINSTSVNATITEPIINSTSVNATITEPIINSTSVNATITEPIIEPTENILSTELDSLQNELTETEILANQTSNSIKLDGKDDFVTIANETSTDNLAELTISLWAKPDYSQGSQEFTIISKDNSFVLSINNIITPTKIAKFAVFDGAKWTSVESTSIIDEKWTQLSATFNGTSIQIYVNGQLESTNTLEEKLTLSVNGKLTTTTIDSLSSEADIVIGAYVDIRKGSEQISQQFSGQIDDVSLFNSQLNNLQIKSLYDEKSDYYMSQDSVEIDLDAILAEIIAEQSVNSTSIEPINSTSPESTEIIVTELIVNATLDSIKENYLITENAELTLEFYDEYDVLTNELEELENSLLLLSELEQELEQEPIIVNSTTPNPTVLNFIGMLFTIPKADAAKPTIEDQSQIDIVNAREQILLLKEKINAIKANKEINKQDIKEAKLQLESILTDLKDNANNISQNNDHMTQKIQNSVDDIKKIGDVESEDTIQENVWIGNEEQITTEIYDSQGNLVDLKANYEKIRDGKFKINLDFDTNDKPGLYKIKTVLLVNGETHTVESEFAWGLVSLNTKKSTYKPGETAEFVIVVLDSEGHPIDNASLTMDITNPTNQVTRLSSNNGIVSGSETGLYDASYATSSEGTYNVFIHANADGIDTDFNTTFDVKSFYEFDIIRTAQSKIDPTSNPNLFDVKIDIESFIGYTPLEIIEYVPASFEVITDGQIKQIGDKKIITWNKELLDGRTEIMYTYSIPMIFPKLYALGPVEIHSEQSQFFEARNWFVAADPIITYFDPAADIADGWTTVCSINHFTCVDDAVRQPTNAATLGDGVVISHTPGTSAIIDTQHVNSITGTPNSITLWAYVSTGTKTTLGINLQNSAGVTQATSGTLPADTAAGWQSVTWNNPGTDPGQVRASFSTVRTGGANGPATVYAWYLEVNSPLNASVPLLTERLGVTDAVSVIKSRIISLTENLGVTDAVSTNISTTISLTENLGLTDAVSANTAKTVSL